MQRDRDRRLNGRDAPRRRDERSGAGDPSDTARRVLEEHGIKPFASEYKRLLSITRSEDFTSRTARQALLRAQLGDAIQRLGAIGRIDDVRAAYAAAHLGDHLRALSLDLQSIGDSQVLVDRVRTTCLQPGLASLATQIVSALTSTRSRIYSDSRVDRESARAVDKMLGELQRSIAPVFGEQEAEMLKSLERAVAQ